MKIAAVIGAWLLATSAAAVADVQRIEIVEYGIYTADKTACKRDDQGIERCQRSKVRHAATTWNIPAQIGVEFGLRYRVVGAPNGERVSVKRIWVLPGPGFRPPQPARPIRRLERIDEATIGGTTFVSYGFDDRWELVPGPWILEFWYEGRKLDEKRFIIEVKP